LEAASLHPTYDDAIPLCALCWASQKSQLLWWQRDNRTDRVASSNDRAERRPKKLRVFVTSITAHKAFPLIVDSEVAQLSALMGSNMSFNYLIHSSDFTRIAAFVVQMADHAVDLQIEKISQNVRPDPATLCLNRPMDLSELLSRTIAP